MRITNCNIDVKINGEVSIFNIEIPKFNELIRQFPNQHNKTPRAEWVTVGAVTFFRSRKQDGATETN